MGVDSSDTLYRQSDSTLFPLKSRNIIYQQSPGEARSLKIRKGRTFKNGGNSKFQCDPPSSRKIMHKPLNNSQL
jgi:hypothetical protein